MAKFELLDDELDMAGVHASLLPNGKVLFFAAVPPDDSGTQNTNNENDVNKGMSQLFSEEDGVESSVLMNRNLFCSGHCFLPDGRLLIAAGQSNNWPNGGSPGPGQWGADHDIHTFDPENESFARHNDMPAARYYPTCVTLPDGNALICSGAWARTDPAGLTSINHEAEIFDWRSSSLGVPFPFDPGFIETMYPFMQILPSEDGLGNVFVFSKNRARLYSLSDKAWIDAEFHAISDKNRNYHHQGSAIMLPFDSDAEILQIMVIGGEGTTHDEATKTAEIFTYRISDPSDSSFRSPDGGNMNNKRFMGDSVHLFDGKILVVNGAKTGAADHSGEPVLQAEIFDPEDETWTTSEDLNKDRMYHSTAILLPSGKVLIAGNTQNWNEDNQIEEKSLELFVPDYVDASRPVILKVPEKAAYNQKFQVEVEDSSVIEKVALIRCASVTHTNNMDQRYIRVPFTVTGPETITVSAPGNGAIAPPGHYMVVIIDDNTIPSEAKIMAIGPETSGFVEIVNERIVVKESDTDVDPDITLRAGDEFEITAKGEIWAGVLLTFNNGPQGWNNIDTDPKFPLKDSSNAHPYCLIAKFGARGDYFYVGKSLSRQAFDGATSKRLLLSINDDAPGNGNGEFECTVKVWRNMIISSSVGIIQVVADPSGNDVAANAGEFVVLQNSSATSTINVRDWMVTDAANNRLKIDADISIAPGQLLEVHTGPGTNLPGKYFAGKGRAMLNNSGDALNLLDAEGNLVSVFVY